MVHLRYILFNVEAKSFQQLKITNCNKIIRENVKKDIVHQFPTSFFFAPLWHGQKHVDTAQSAGPVWKCGVLGVPAQPQSVQYGPFWPGSLLQWPG